MLNIFRWRRRTPKGEFSAPIMTVNPDATLPPVVTKDYPFTNPQPIQPWTPPKYNEIYKDRS